MTTHAIQHLRRLFFPPTSRHVKRSSPFPLPLPARSREKRKRQYQYHQSFTLLRQGGREGGRERAQRYPFPKTCLQCCVCATRDREGSNLPRPSKRENTSLGEAGEREGTVFGDTAGGGTAQTLHLKGRTPRRADQRPPAAVAREGASTEEPQQGVTPLRRPERGGSRRGARR